MNSDHVLRDESLLAGLARSVAALFIFTLITGVAYPLAITAIAQLAMEEQADGSLVRSTGASESDVVGSRLIGQPFRATGYFWSRPSATGPHPYNAAASSGSNLGPLNPALVEAIRSRVEVLRAADPENPARVPIDLVTASGSGLDPHISPAAASYQVGRVARARGLDSSQVAELVRRQIEPRTLGFLGEPRVNVLELNLALDALAGGPPASDPATAPTSSPGSTPGSAPAD